MHPGRTRTASLVGEGAFQIDPVKIETVSGLPASRTRHCSLVAEVSRFGKLKAEVASHESQTLLADQRVLAQIHSDKQASGKQQVAVSVRGMGQEDCSRSRVLPGQRPSRSAQKDLEQPGDHLAAVLAESAQADHLAVPWGQIAPSSRYLPASLVRQWEVRSWSIQHSHAMEDIGHAAQSQPAW